jgi:lipoyl(octanoyl) transferase
MGEPAACEWVWLGRVPYADAFGLQERIRHEVTLGRAPETLLLLEHDPVITLGRHGDAANILTPPERLAEQGIAIVRTSRGGDVTYHGQGQLVGYPVFRLHHGIRAHLSRMAEAILAVLGELGIEADWRESRPGLWVGGDKICAVGVHVLRRTTIHGFALNASTDLARFSNIVPCGLPDAGVTSIAKLIGSAPALAVLAERVALAFGRSFAVSMKPIAATSSRLQMSRGDL